MNGQNFKKKVDQLWNTLNTSIHLINKSDKDWVLKAEEVLMETDTAIRKLKEYVRQYTFKDWGEEILFFKTTKPKFISIYIYYSKLLAIESSKPYADPDILRKYYEDERAKLLHFYQEQKELISYYRRKATYLDKKYFTRFKFDFKLSLTPELYSYDENFSTSHDHIIARIMANDRLEAYLSHQINSEDNAVGLSYTGTQLEWTAPKVALVELLYALYHTKCFNRGNVDLSEVVRTMEKVLNIDLSNFHKVLGEVRSRKTGRTKFLQLLNESLDQHFTDLDQY